MVTAQTAVDRLRRDLLGFGDIKVWSMLVTIFGDLASVPGADLPGPVLSALGRRIAIKPEALRVALHRLRKDGWIEATKDGRISRYRMSAHARAETEAVRGHVYGLGPETQDTAAARWRLVVLPPDRLGACPAGTIPLGRNLILTQDTTGHGDALVATLAPGPLPPWAQNQIAPQDLCTAFDTLTVLLSRAPPREVPDAGDAMALRLLVLHRWRRLVLRHTVHATEVLGPNWSGARCRASVQKWLVALPRRDLGALTD